MGRKCTKNDAIRGKTESITNPDVKPGNIEIVSLKRAHIVGPKLDVAQAKPIKIPLMVDVISGAIFCPIIIFDACPL